MKLQTLSVIGAGAWGTALALSARRAGRDVILWAREPELVASMREQRENSLFLPGIPLDPAIHVTQDLAEAGAADVILLVTPAQFLRPTLAALAPEISGNPPLVICAKGIEKTTGKRLTEVVREVCPKAPLAVLSGPSFAQEVAKNLPTAVTLACEAADLGAALVSALGHRMFRPYLSDDLLGVEIGGAVKNVLAIAAGIVSGRELGANAHAALVTRGFAELVRFGRAHGAKLETLHGLSGLGDLILTCSSPLSRNMSLGQALGRGKTLEDILAERRSVSEGVSTAAAVARIAEEKGIDMPICQAVQAVVSGSLSVDEAITALLSRPFRSETG